MIKGSTKLIYKEDNWSEYAKKFKTVQEVADQIEEALSDKNWGFDYPRMVREYFGGMYVCLKEFYKVLPYCPRCHRPLEETYASWLEDGVHKGYRCPACGAEHEGDWQSIFDNVTAQIRKNYYKY